MNNPGGYAWLVFAIGVIVYEIYATMVPHGQTLSEWIWMYSPGHPWFKYIVLTGMSLLMYHFFWQRRH